MALHGEVGELRVYTLDPVADQPLQTPRRMAGLPDGPSMNVFLLPPLAEGRYFAITEMASRAPSGRPDDAVEFELDARLTVLAVAISFHTRRSEFNADRPRSDDSSKKCYVLVVPVSALLAQTYNHSSQDTPGSEEVPRPREVPWEAWGQACSRFFPLLQHWRTCRLRAVGSKVLFYSFWWSDPVSSVCDMFVCDFHWGEYGDEKDDKGLLAQHMDTADTITDAGNLREPIHNRLPFHALYKPLVYEDDDEYAIGGASITLLEDGIALTVRVVRLL